MRLIVRSSTNCEAHRMWARQGRHSGKTHAYREEAGRTACGRIPADISKRTYQVRWIKMEKGIIDCQRCLEKMAKCRHKNAIIPEGQKETVCPDCAGILRKKLPKK